MNNLESELKRTFKPKRWVYGTKKKQWYLIDKRDRDFETGLTQKEFRQLGVVKAKERYLHSLLA